MCKKITFIVGTEMMRKKGMAWAWRHLGKRVYDVFLEKKRKEGKIMLVSIGAILNVRKILGWHEKVMELPEGSTLRDWLKAIQVPDRGNVYEMMVDKEGRVEGHYRMYLDERRVNEEMLGAEVKDHDRLVMMDAVSMPSLSFLND
jgi:hypothetical protein